MRFVGLFRGGYYVQRLSLFVHHRHYLKEIRRWERFRVRLMVVLFDHMMNDWSCVSFDRI